MPPLSFADVEGYGFAPMRQVIAKRLSRGEPMPSLDQLRVGGDQRIDYSLPLVRQFFFLDVNAHAVTPPVPAPLQTWMLARFISVARERRRNGDPQSIRADVGGAQYLIAYGCCRSRPAASSDSSSATTRSGRFSSGRSLAPRRRRSSSWGYADSVVTRTVDTHIAELWRKLEEDLSAPQHILTVGEIGYR